MCPCIKDGGDEEGSEDEDSDVMEWVGRQCSGGCETEMDRTLLPLLRLILILPPPVLPPFIKLSFLTSQ